jgi:23S rRNA (uracil1939-C5)-methyltransferase
MAKEVIVEFSDMAHGGSAVGRETAGGKAIFVPYALPGDVARVEIERDHGKMAIGRLRGIVAPSAHRVEPPCPYFGHCGGCHWQHVRYSAQLEYKRAIVRNQLQRIGKVADANVRPVVGMETPWAYRNNAQFAVGGQGELGFMAANSHNVVPVQHCLLLHPLLADLFETLDLDVPGMRQLGLRAGLRTGEQMLVLEMSNDEQPDIELKLPVSCVLLLSNGLSATLAGSPFLRETLGGRTYRISAASFFQVNTEQAEKLIELVTEAVACGPRGPVLDAYCGVGTFAVAVAHRVERVVGIDSVAGAVEDARANATEDSNVTFLSGKVEEVLPRLDDIFAQVILDPPRTGVQKPVLSTILQKPPQQIIYVSCDPATLARDISVLAPAGYHLQWVQPVDMFPQTYHIESVAVLVRETSR